MPISFPILTFHAIDDRPSVIAFSPSLFQSGMSKLHSAGYRTLALSDVVKVLRRNEPFPKNSFAVTFDDGYQSVYDCAFPVLARCGFSATVFLTIGKNLEGSDSQRLPSMSERSMLSWDEIKEMHRSGITFGAHTLTHPDLTRLPEDQIKTEINRSKFIIEDRLGTGVDAFAYPFGRYDEKCRNIVKGVFDSACSDKLGLIHSRSDVYALERVDAFYLRTERLFELILTNLFPLYVQALAIPRQIRRLVQT